MQEINWSTLPFGYMKTNFNVRATYKDGAWSELELSDSEYLPIHISAACLHYGTEAFEGLKAYCGADGKVRLFRPEENAKRLQSTSRKLCMAEVPTDLFVDACKRVVAANREFVPPYGTGATLYLRPFLIGTNAVLGVSAATEFIFCIFVSPVGPYFKAGIKPINVVIDVEHDRAAPRGTGDVKCGGNYASSIYSGEKAHNNGFANVLYLDAIHREFIEECGAANFFGIKEGTYITPKSTSILPSITNMSLRQLAADMGLKVEERTVSISELPSFDECGACGTAAVISPIGSVSDYRNDNVISYGDNIGQYCQRMYDTLIGIQHGTVEDTHNWTIVIE